MSYPTICIQIALIDTLRDLLFILKGPFRTFIVPEYKFTLSIFAKIIEKLYEYLCSFKCGLVEW